MSYDPRNHRGPRHCLHYSIADVAEAAGISYSCLYANCKKLKVNLRRLTLRELVNLVNQLSVKS